MTHPLDPKRVCGALVFARAGGALGTPDARISRLVMVPPEQASWDAIQRSYSMGMTDFIGKGGQASVFALPPQNDLYIANKALAVKMGGWPVAQGSTSAHEREFNMLSTIKSRYIIEYYSFFEIEGVMQGITMKKCAMTLGDLIKMSGALDQKQFVLLVSQSAEGLQALHDAGVAHNDIKPDNILIDGEVVKLCDFGLASNGKLIVFGGTPQFMSPEVFARRAARQWLASAPLSSRNVPRDECKELVDLLQLGEGTSSFSGDVYSLAVSWLCAALGVHRPFPSLDYTPSKDNSATQHADHAYHFFGVLDHFGEFLRDLFSVEQDGSFQPQNRAPEFEIVQGVDEAFLSRVLEIFLKAICMPKGRCSLKEIVACIADAPEMHSSRAAMSFLRSLPEKGPGRFEIFGQGDQD